LSNFVWNTQLNHKLAKEIKKRYPKCKVIFGGLGNPNKNRLDNFFEEYDYIDMIVNGEGELTFENILIESLKDKPNYTNVEGISTKDFITNDRQRIKDIDYMPSPYLDGLFDKLVQGSNETFEAPIESVRGCPYQCTFCSSPLMWTTKWQARDVDCVIEEMQLYINKYEAQNFDFYDLTTIVKKDWIVNFCQKIIKKNWNITWQMPAGTRSEALDDETLGLMVLSGQKHISYAPESGSKITLQKIKKKIKIERMKESIRSAISKGMSVKLNLMLGFPHETHKEMFQTLNFVKDAAMMGVTDVYIASFSPYPGSELFEQMYENGQIPEINDEYFLNLTSYSDLIRSYSYSKHVGHRMLTFYRLGGMSMFYIINFIFHPKRLFRVFSNIINKREESKLDKGLIEMIDRVKRSKKKRPPSYIP